MIESGKRCVYALVCYETMKIYIGLTSLYEVSERQHVREPMRSMRKTGTITRLSYMIPTEEAIALEKTYIQVFRSRADDLGLECVNKSDGGELGRVQAKKHLCSDGKLRNIKEVAKHFNVPLGSLRNRMQAGDTLEEALRPIHKAITFKVGTYTRTIKDWSEITGISAPLLRYRYKKGMQPHLIIQKPQ